VGVKVKVGMDVSVGVCETVGAEVGVSVAASVVDVGVDGFSVAGLHAETNKMINKMIR